MLHEIIRMENEDIWRPYKLHRDNVYRESMEGGWPDEGLEMYLWHGADADVAEKATKEGFATTRTNLEFNVYGVGLYFGVDPRLSHHFIAEAHNQPHVRSRLILARVVVAHCAPRGSAPAHVRSCMAKTQTCTSRRCLATRTAELRKLENRSAPAGSNSCISCHRSQADELWQSRIFSSSASINDARCAASALLSALRGTPTDCRRERLGVAALCHCAPSPQGLPAEAL